MRARPRRGYFDELLQEICQDTRQQGRTRGRTDTSSRRALNKSAYDDAVRMHDASAVGGKVESGETQGTYEAGQSHIEQRMRQSPSVMFEVILIRIVGNHRRVTQHPGAYDIPGVQPQGHVLRRRGSKRRRRRPQRHFVIKRQRFARGRRAKNNLRATLSSVANQRLRIINAETSHDLSLEIVCPRFECRAKPSRDRAGQSNRVIAPRPDPACKHRPQFTDGVGNLA